MKTLLSAVVGAVLALGAIEASAQISAREQQISLAIKSTNLAEALDQWAVQGGYQIVAPKENWDVARKVLVPGLSGIFSAQAALEKLLEGTPLTCTWLSDRAVSIRDRRQASPTTIRTIGDTGVREPPGVARLTDDSQAGFHVAAGSELETQRQGSSAPGAAGNREVQDLEEVFVTGTHLRDARAIVNRFVVRREQIDASGYAASQDFLKLLPQNFGGGQNEPTGGPGNFNRGTAANLRGLGPGATLTLVDGRRAPTSGVEGDFVDVSMIPSSAIERIEVLTDGASAVYGSDAIAGVVNFVLRKDFSGAETRARYAAAEGGSGEELLVSQLFGTDWSTGHVFAGFQYQERNSLLSSDRDFAASADKRPFGGDDFRSTSSNPGNILDPATFTPAYAIPRSQDGTGLAPDDLLSGTVNLQDISPETQLLPDSELRSAFFSLTQRLGDRIDLALGGRYGERSVSAIVNSVPQVLFVPSTNPFFVDPFGGSDFLFIAYDFTRDLGPIRSQGKTKTYAAYADLSFDIGSSWRASAVVGHGRESLTWDGTNLVDMDAVFAALSDPDPDTAFNPFGDGSHTNVATLDAIRMVQHERAASTVKDATVSVDGPVFTVPGGSANLAMGVDFRNEELETGTGITQADLDRDVLSAFAEMSIPLIGGIASRPTLDLSLAARYDDYSDFGSSLNPKLGVRFAPNELLSLHATWGTSFRAPRLIDVNDQTEFATVTNLLLVPDPQAEGGASFILLREGKNSALKEETARTWTAGFEVTPVATWAPSLSLTYFHISYDDQIIQPSPSSLDVLLVPDQQWSPFVTRGPTQAEIAALCNGAPFQGSPSDCDAFPPAAIVDLRLHNVAHTTLKGLDASIHKELVVKRGALEIGATATYLLSQDIKATDASPAVDVIDTVHNPAGLRIRGEMSYKLGDLGFSAAVNHTGGYRDPTSVPARSVDSWTTVDLRVSLDTPRVLGPLGGIEVALSAVNVFNSDPPFINSVDGYDPANANALNRFIGLQIQKVW